MNRRTIPTLVLGAVALTACRDSRIWETEVVRPIQAETVIEADPGTAIHDIQSVGDVDGDGRADVVVRLRSEAGDPVRADLYLGAMLAEGGVFRGSEAQASVAGYVLGVSPAGDLDGDGLDDVVIGDPLGYGVYTGADLATPGSRDLFDAPWTVDGFRDDATLLGVLGPGDVDGDGKDDLVILDEAKHKPRVWVVDLDHVAEGETEITGGGSLAADVERVLDLEEIQLVAVGDVTGDGLPDVVMRTDHYAYGLLSDDALTSVYPMDKEYLERLVAVGDVDGDGQADVGVESSEGVSLVLKKGHVAVLPLPRQVSLWAGAGELDCVDGAELLLGQGDHVLLAQGGRNLGARVLHRFEAGSHGAALDDLTGDGRREIATWTPGGDALHLFLAPEAPCSR